MATFPFAPEQTQSFACSTTPLAAQPCRAGQVLRFSVDGAEAIGVAFGASNIASVITYGTAMSVTRPELFTVPGGATHWSAVMATGPGTLKVTPGSFA